MSFSGSNFCCRRHHVPTPSVQGVVSVVCDYCKRRRGTFGPYSNANLLYKTKLQTLTLIFHILYLKRDDTSSASELLQGMFFFILRVESQWCCLSQSSLPAGNTSKLITNRKMCWHSSNRTSGVVLYIKNAKVLEFDLLNKINSNYTHLTTFFASM